MRNPLVRYFFLMISVVLFLTVGISFFTPPNKLDITNINFSTTQSSELYFKNMRSFFYDIEQRKDANFILYRIKTREKDSLMNKLNFVLVSNWLQSECYILAESELFNISKTSLRWSYGRDKGEIFLKGKDSYSNYLFAVDLFFQIDRGATLAFETKEDSFPFSESEKKSLKRTLKDYFKLVGKIR